MVTILSSRIEVALRLFVSSAVTPDEELTICVSRDVTIDMLKVMIADRMACSAHSILVLSNPIGRYTHADDTLARTLRSLPESSSSRVIFLDAYRVGS